MDNEVHPRTRADDVRDVSQAAYLFMFVCGVLTGAAVALMSAPASGRDTRGWIRDRTAAAGRQTRQFVRDRNEAVQSIIRRRGVLGLVYPPARRAPGLPH